MNPKTTILTLSCLLALCVSSDANENQFDDTMERVLAMDNFALAESLSDTSEAGQNDAARIQAEARRIRTETRLAKQSMRRVVVSAEWRRALNLWYDAQYEMLYLHEGGGTMWLHIMARNDIEVEEFIAGIAADQLPRRSSSAVCSNADYFPISGSFGREILVPTSSANLEMALPNGVF